MRFLGVIAYWIILAMALIGWRQLHKKRPLVASAFLAYALMFTVLHLPLVMSTRIRFPLMDPFIAILGGGSVLSLKVFQKHEVIPDHAFGQAIAWPIR